MRSFGMGESIILNRREASGQYDDYGNVIYVETSDVVTGVAVWPESASEFAQSMERTNSVYVIALPTGIPIDAIDFITWRGKNYEVQGEPERLQSPFTGTDLQTIRMARVEG